ncbi:hypothetical protein Q3G72_034103 [Acer saccharum]|nr:hypothetical protein Q3G72_034103 [Acer saccharum]
MDGQYSTAAAFQVAELTQKCLDSNLENRPSMKEVVKMEGQYPSRAALQAAQLNLRCLELDPRSRPSMKEVMEVLKEIEAQAGHLHHEEVK